MHFSDIIGNLGSNHIWGWLWFLQWEKPPLQPLDTLWIFLFWSVNYANLVYKLFVIFWECEDTKTLFILFFSHIRWSYVSKFHNFFFWHAWKLLIFEGFKYCPLKNVHFQLSDTFVAFLIWSVICLRDFFITFVGQ